MPDREVKTIKDLIYYQYAKIIAKSALGAEAKKEAYGFIKTTFRQLRDDAKKKSDIVPELLEKKYLKTIYYCHLCNGTLDNEGGKNFSVLDLDL